MSRVAVIGAGPAGLCMVYHLERLRMQDPDSFKVGEVVCFEKQEKMGGLWNYDWNTGVDSQGEAVHSTMYRTLWTNSCKEGTMEFPDYTFMDHWGVPMPSYMTREPFRQYLEARMAKMNVVKFIKFKHVVQQITFCEDRNVFSVVARDLAKEVTHEPEEFDYVINATGHFSTPQKPHFEGMETFAGRLLHSGEFRNPEEFRGQDVLVVGSSVSADDIAVMCMKYGAKSATLSYRTNPGGVSQFPFGIQVRPLLTNVNRSEVTFKDGHKGSFNSIIFCTGYMHHYPHMPDPMKLKSKNEYYPDNLYKGVLFLPHGGNQLFYMGAQDQLYTWSLVDCQAAWISKVLNGNISLPSHEDMRGDVAQWRNRLLNSCSNIVDFMHLQTDYLLDLAKLAGYDHDMDSREHWMHVFNVKCGSGEGYGPEKVRDKVCKSKFTGVLSAEPIMPFLEQFEEDTNKLLQPYLQKKA